MHILLFSEIDPQYSEKNRFHWLWEALRKEHTVTVFALRDTSKTEKKYTEALESVHYLNEAPMPPTLVEAFPYMGVAAIKRFHAKKPFDIIISYNGLRFSAALRHAFPKLPFWYDLCDDLADLASSSSLMPKIVTHIVREVARWYVRRNCMLADRVITTTPLLLEHFKVAPQSSHIMPNGYQWSDNPPFVELPAKKDGTRWITFVGALREWVDVQSVIRDMKRWPAHWQLVIAGNEGQLQQLKNFAEAEGMMQRIHFLGHIPHASLPHLLRLSDAGIIPFKKSTTTDLAVTLKLMEYMSCGVPTVATSLKATNAMFGQNIHTVDNGDWMNGIERAFADTRDTRSVVRDYTWNALLASLMANLPTSRS